MKITSTRFIANERRRSWEAPKTTKTRIYVTLHGFDGDDREWLKAARLVANQALEDLGLADELGSFTFNRKAGCSCGCSPAFVTKAHRSTHSLFINATNEEG